MFAKLDKGPYIFAKSTTKRLYFLRLYCGTINQFGWLHNIRVLVYIEKNEHCVRKSRRAFKILTVEEGKYIK